jgi:hypothetical protein
MRVAHFPSQCAQNSQPVMAALLSSLNAAGVDTVENSLDADAAIIWSVLWSGRMAANQLVWSKYRQNHLPVVVVDVGALDRGHTWKIALNNITAAGYYGHQQNLDWDRPARLGISLGTGSKTCDRVLVAGQHKKSLQLAGVDQEQWLVEKINEIDSDKSIVVRPHPRCALDRSRFPKHLLWEEPKQIPGTYDSFDLHWNFDMVINYNSGPGIQAVLAGVPVVCDPSSLAYGVVDRQQWLVEICHTEYTLEEIKQGIWIKRLGLMTR